MMDDLKWRVQYRKALTVAAFASQDDAERYINAKEQTIVKDRLTIEEVEE